MKKIIYGLTALIASTTGQIQADAYQCDYQENVSCCESSCGKITISGDFLYWKAYQNGLNYCFADGFTVQDIGDTTFYTFDSEIKNPNSKWDPGYRVGAAWEFGGSDFEVGAVWTHYNTHAKAELGAQNLHWHLDFDVIDAGIGYNILNNCPLSLKLFGGVRLAQIDQKTHSFRQNFFLGLTKIDRNRQNFRGAGPVVGLELDWNVGCGFGFYVDGAVSALYGSHHTRYNNVAIRVLDVRIQTIRQNTCAYVGALDAGLGIKWTREFCNDKSVFVKLGAELHRYFSYNRLGDHDDLCLDGGRVSAGFQF